MEIEGKSKDFKNLAKLELGDEELQHFFYKILHGTQDSKLLDQGGYPPFTKFIAKSNKKLSVFLADSRLLLSFFPRDGVNEIVNKRKELHSQVSRKNSPLEKDKATEELEALCARYLPLQYRGLLDFRVTTTKPPEIDSF